MARVVEDHYGGDLSGLVVTRYGHAVPCRSIEIVEAARCREILRFDLKTPVYISIDIDALDPALADQLEALATHMLGFAPVRYGKAPKRLMLYRATDAAASTTSAGSRDRRVRAATPARSKSATSR